MPTLKQLEGWMTTSQVAERLGITRQRVVTLANESRLRTVKVGGQVWVFDPKDVERYADERRRR